ncbi:MAG: Male sterility domain protein [Bryobacterales bacterium]|nr:Male sterility domain protein [Bryobacterales bacterium]
MGGLLLRRLAEEYPGRTVYALVRTWAPETDLPNAHLVFGDITRPRLGIPAGLYSRLCQSIDTIVHCAASTKFTLPLAASRQVNLHGTANIVQLARRSRQLKMLLHVSTTYIAGRKDGPLREAPMSDPDGWFSPYEQSKFEAEQFIYAHADCLPWVIARLSTVVGNSRTGHISRFNYFHQLLRLVPRNPLPFIPGDPDALVDVVADDWVTHGLLEVLRRKTIPRTVFHLCAGPHQSLPAQEVVELAFRLHRRRQPASSVTIPSFVSLDQFQAFAAELRRTGKTTLSRMAELLLVYLPHLELNQPFLNTETNRFLDQCGVTPPRTRDFLPGIIESCF